MSGSLCYNQLNDECICHVKKKIGFSIFGFKKVEDKITTGFTLDCALTTVKYFSATALYLDAVVDLLSNLHLQTPSAQLGSLFFFPAKSKETPAILTAGTRN